MDRSQLSPLDYRILALFEKAYDECRPSPVVREISAALDISSTNTVHLHLKKLERAGFILCDKKKARGIRLSDEFLSHKKRDDSVPIPVWGNIVAGNPIPVPDTTADYTERSTVFISRALLPHTDIGKLFALRVKGDSMIDACVLDGDIVILKQVQDPQTEIRNGNMVAAWLINEQEATLKRYYYISGEVELRPENPRYKTIPVERENLEIRGKVVHVSRQVH